MSIILNLKAKKNEQIRRGFAYWWSVMMDFEMKEQAFDFHSILAVSDKDDATLRDFMKRLIKAGYIAPQNPDEEIVLTKTLFRVVKRQSLPPKVRRDGSIIHEVSKQQAMWNLMRGPVGRMGFSADDLVLWASIEQYKISRQTAGSYISKLASAGYLLCLEKQNSRQSARWKLYPDMITGSFAPMILRTKLVFDPNLHEVMGPVEAHEVAL